MTRLLVSVQNAAEAHAACACGVDLLDAKDPSRGALGPVSRTVLAEIVSRAGKHCPISAAGGELLEFSPALGPDLPLLSQLSFFKLGLAGCALRSDWVDRWQSAWESLPASVQRVAVVYADCKQVAAPEPGEIIAQASSVGCRAVLFDTVDKRAGDLFGHLPQERLASLIGQVHSAGLLAVVGGSLTLETIPLAIRAGADVVAVRSAACAGSRSGSLDPSRLRALIELMAASHGRTGRKIAKASPV